MAIFPKSCDFENFLLLRRKSYLTEGDKLPLIHWLITNAKALIRPIEDVDKDEYFFVYVFYGLCNTVLGSLSPSVKHDLRRKSRKFSKSQLFGKMAIESKRLNEN